jgi:membrane glycosyltransferase
MLLGGQRYWSRRETHAGGRNHRVRARNFGSTSAASASAGRDHARPSILARDADAAAGVACERRSEVVVEHELDVDR